MTPRSQVWFVIADCCGIFALVTVVVTVIAGLAGAFDVSLVFGGATIALALLRAWASRESRS